MKPSLFVFLVAVAAGAAGCVSPLSPPPSAQAVYACDQGRRLSARFVADQREMTFGDSPFFRLPHDTAALKLDDGADVVLAKARSDRGFLYETNGYVFRGDGAEAVYSTPEGSYRCRATG
jgi:hypothetical protein